MTKKEYARIKDFGEKYATKGLKSMLFPSREFGKQEYEDNAEILAFAVRIVVPLMCSV